MPPPKPTIIVVPGAWHQPAHFEPLATSLRAKEYKVIVVRLPSLHYSKLNQPVPNGVVEDVEAIKSIATRELNDYPDYDILILTHSYSSVLGSVACQDLDKLSRRAAGHTNGIAGLMTIAGLLLPAGMSILDSTGGQVPPCIQVWQSSYSDGRQYEVSMPASPPGANELLYHDLPVTVAEHWASNLRPHIYEGHRIPIPFAGHLVLPTYYLMCEDDRMLAVEEQRFIVEEANKQMPAGKEVKVTMIDSGHNPFLSQIEETVNWIRRCAGEVL
ncbi:hypothetical protein PV08_09361 [Exophiala spinifera]|uniref:AB hydrolase-1 domain-containing protein n=1 Tax=Exophiala spinifera TaxID=91928 RepID=A0A0D1ZGJ3_9EURO|nr:uncharacterized protein PV08_09361 [Exophiala spinifera]KIW12087.1 hypothetical protein PV08_09361 [Exophiala spinifera]